MNDAGHHLVERDGELALLRRLAERARDGEPAVVEVDAPPGHRRSALLHAAASIGRARGLRVLRARATSGEQGLHGGVLAQFLADLDPAAALPTRQRSAVPQCRVFLNAARERPLLLTLDDAEWCDEHSVRLLSALARRLEGVPLLLVLGVGPRPTAACPSRCPRRRRGAPWRSATVGCPSCCAGTTWWAGIGCWPPTSC